MDGIEQVNTLDFDDIDTMVFAGGGNRCWWQAGIVERLLAQGIGLPEELIGTSAGASVAAACITIGPTAALQVCLDLFAGNPSMLEWEEGRRWRPRFVHDRLYPVWIASLIHEASLAAIRASSRRLLVALAHPSETLGLAASIALATLAYAVETIRDSLHPTLPRRLGLRQSFVGLHECASAEEARTLLVAAASVAPMLAPRRFADLDALDGGYIDHAPVYEQEAAQRRRTLVLLTRHYPKLPPLFRWNDRVYWQPSVTVPVSIWDCTPRATVRDAFAHGWNDADALLAAGCLHGGGRRPAAGAAAACRTDAAAVPRAA